MIKYAISGNIASGKSTVESILRDFGYLVFDTDIIAHQLLNQSKNEIIDAFAGYDILENNEISRKKLGNFVFKDKNLKEILEKILHPKIKNEILNILKKNEKEKVVFVSIPLLFELGWQNMFDKVLFVSANDEIRLQRLMKRNSLSIEQAKERLQSQMSQNKKVELSDFIICNNEDKPCLQKQVNEFIILLKDEIGEN